MKNSNKYLIQRAAWYLVGLALFYAPFALFQRFLISIFKVKGSTDIHGACFRMAIQGLFTGKGLNIFTTTGIIIILILLSAVLIGPIFCGRFCAAGAISEYISRVIPDSFKINWQKNINPTPVRYGVLAGFLIVPFLGLSVVCAYCNYTIMEKLILGGASWDLGVLGSTAILTAFIWLVVLGAFAKGGRGYCSYLCTIGATQSLLHSIGAKFGFTYKLKYSAEKCVSCNLCVKDCPMGALQSSEDGLKYNIHSCITCHQCQHICPKTAMTFGRGKSCWNESFKEKVEEPQVIEEGVSK
jgi:Polyferredoxin